VGWLRLKSPLQEDTGVVRRGGLDPAEASAPRNPGRVPVEACALSTRSGLIPCGLVLGADWWYTRPVTTSYIQMLRLFSRDFRLFLVAAALVGLAWDGFRAVLFNLYLLRLGYGPEFIGLINAAGALAFALLCPPAGAAGTRWGSRRVLIAGAAVITAGFVSLPLAGLMPMMWRTGWLLAVTLLTYAGFALFLVNGLPFMMSTTGPRERIHAFSIHSALVPLAAMLGSLAAGVLPEILSSLLGMPLDRSGPYGFPLWVAALILIPGLLALLATRPIDKPARSTLASQAASTGKSPAPYVMILVIAVSTGLRFGGRATQSTFFNVYMDDGLGVSTALIGAVISLSQLLAVLAALSVPFLVAHWGNGRTVFWGTLGMAVCSLPLALIPRWTAASAGFASSAALFSSTVGPVRVFSQELVSERWRAAMASAFMMGAGLAFSGVSLLGGFVIVGSGYRALFLLAAALSAAGAFLFWGYFRVPRGKMERLPASEGDRGHSDLPSSPKS
jgi:MFS family permease